MTSRRQFIGSVIGGILATSLVTEAQQVGKVYRIGVLTVEPPNPPNLPLYDAFEQELRERGWVVGQNIAIERRVSEGKAERFPDLAAELVRLKADVIVTVSNAAAHAAKRATDTIPIVMAVSSLPDRYGLIVATLARPGGNITGLSLDIGPEIAGKMLQLLKESAPAVSQVSIILARTGIGGVDPWLDPSGTTTAKEIEWAARTLGVTLQPVVVRSPDEFTGALNALTGARTQALLVDNSALAFVQRSLIIDFAAKHRLPAIYGHTESAEGGGLLAYGADLRDLFRRSGLYVDKILKGAKPADLPVEQPTKFKLVVNLKTAKALGLTIPQSVLLRADEVIQ